MVAAGGVRDAAAQGEFNGSLWTLPIEARMSFYLAVGRIAFAWWPQIRVRTLSYVAPIAAALMFVVIFRARAQGVLGNGNVEIFMFFMGSSLYFWREKLFMNRITFVALPLIVIAVSLLIGPPVAFPLFSCASRRSCCTSPKFPAVRSGASTPGATIPTASISTLSLSSRRWRFSFPRSRSWRWPEARDWPRSRLPSALEPGREAGDGTEGRLRRGDDARAERGRRALCALARGSQAEQAFTQRAVDAQPLTPRCNDVSSGK